MRNLFGHGLHPNAGGRRVTDGSVARPGRRLGRRFLVFVGAPELGAAWSRPVRRVQPGPRTGMATPLPLEVRARIRSESPQEYIERFGRPPTGSATWRLPGRAIASVHDAVAGLDLTFSRSSRSRRCGAGRRDGGPGGRGRPRRRGRLGPAVAGAPCGVHPAGRAACGRCRQGGCSPPGSPTETPGRRWPDRQEPLCRRPAAAGVVRRGAVPRAGTGPAAPRGRPRLRYGVFFEFLVHTGLRRGEALALTWSDMDLDERLVRVRGTLARLNGEPGSPSRSPPSHGARSRSPTRPRRPEAGRRAHPVRAGPGRQLWVESDHVFVTDVGKPCDPRNALRALTMAARQAALPHVGCTPCGTRRHR